MVKMQYNDTEVRKARMERESQSCEILGYIWLLFSIQKS